MSKTICQTVREQKFIDYCMSAPFDEYWKWVRKRCSKLVDDSVIANYERLADWVYVLRTKEQSR